LRELFGENNVFYAGTVDTVRETKARQYVRDFLAAYPWTDDEDAVNKLVRLVSGVKKADGMHPGGLVVLPGGSDMLDYTPWQTSPYDKAGGMNCTHFESRYLHSALLQMNLPEHDIPTMLHLLGKQTGVLPDDIPISGAFGDLIKLYGLARGAGTWEGNAERLLADGVCLLRDVIATRDDIFLYLQEKGAGREQAFTIMEQVRTGRAKGYGLDSDIQKQLRTLGVPGWYLDSCGKILYLIPKAHAVTCLIASVQLRWYKLYHPLAFSAAVAADREHKMPDGAPSH
jgi:DNA polymerase-3 subunit alpha (Gram-positive type)